MTNLELAYVARYSQTHLSDYNIITNSGNTSTRIENILFQHLSDLLPPF